MNCPYCGRKMEQGYLQSRYCLGWSRKGSLIKAMNYILADIPFNRSLETFNCTQCKKFVIEYEEQEEIT